MQRLLVRLGLAAGAALLVFVGVLLTVLPSRSEAREHSVFSFEPAGLRALYLLCEELGFPVEPWSEAPGHLDGRGALLVLTELPEGPPSEPMRASGKSEEDAAPRRSRALAHYRHFVEEGGTLLALGIAPEGLDFLRDDLGLGGLAGVSVEEFVSPGVEVLLAGGERIPLRGMLEVARRLCLSEEGMTVLARAGDGSPVAVSCPSGAGRVALTMLPADWLENEALAGQGDTALVFVRLLEALAPFERVLFDEYALGGWRPVALEALAFSPRLAWLSGHLLLLLLVLGWRSAWSGPFPRDPGSSLAASPLARARGFGRTLARAGRWDLLARLLRRGLLARFEARAGRRAPAGEPDLAARLRALARGDRSRHARLTELFVERAPADERELAALEADLRALELELFAIEKGKTPPRVGAGRPSTGS
jgi:hypothetical protein